MDDKGEERPRASEATDTAWCRENRDRPAAKLFYGLVGKGIPPFSTDEEAFYWLAERSESAPRPPPCWA